MESADSLNKSNLRNQMRQLRLVLSMQVQQNASRQLCANLVGILKQARNVAIYHAVGGEISLTPTIDWLLKRQKNVYQPLAWRETRELRFERTYTSQSNPIFAQIDYQLREEIPANELDIILIPLLAIDKFGHRLGHGGGYYDTTLANCSIPLRCGVGYAWQFLETLPHDPWDVRLDFFVSNQGVMCPES